MPPVLQDILRPQNFGQTAPDQQIHVNRRDVPAGVQIQLDNQGEFFLLQNERVYIDAEPGYNNPEVPSNPPSAGNNTPQSGMSDDIYEDVIHMSNMLEKIMKRIPSRRPDGQAIKTERPKSPIFEKKNTNNYNGRDRNRSQSNNRQRDLSISRDQQNYSGQNRQSSREKYPRGNSQNRRPNRNEYRPRERSNDRNRGTFDRNRSFSQGRPIPIKPPIDRIHEIILEITARTGGRTKVTEITEEIALIVAEIVTLPEIAPIMIT